MISVIFLIPFILIILGYILYRFPPKKINFFYGFRTKMSMKNKKNWDFANKRLAKLLFITGLVMVVITTILFLLNHYKVINLTENNMVVVVLIESAIILLPAFIVENKLKKRK